MVKVICRPRGAGKTTELIKLSAKNHLYIVCKDMKETGRIAGVARNMDLQIPFPITFQEFIDGRFCPKGIKGFYIDNVEDLLSALARGVPVEAFSVTREPDIVFGEPDDPTSE